MRLGLVGLVDDAAVGLGVGFAVSSVAGALLYVSSQTPNIRTDVAELVVYGTAGGAIGGACAGLLEHPAAGAVAGAALGMAVPIVRATARVFT